MVVIFLSAACFVNTQFTSDLIALDPYRIPSECFSGLVSFVIVVCLAEGIVLILLGYDHFVLGGRAEASNAQQPQQQQPDENSPTEKQPLISR